MPLQTISSLEKDIAGLKKEILERDETIGDKEKRIYDLKKKNQVIKGLEAVGSIPCWVKDAGCDSDCLVQEQVPELCRQRPLLLGYRDLASNGSCDGID